MVDIVEKASYLFREFESRRNQFFSHLSSWAKLFTWTICTFVLVFYFVYGFINLVRSNANVVEMHLFFKSAMPVNGYNRFYKSRVSDASTKSKNREFSTSHTQKIANRKFTLEQPGPIETDRLLRRARRLTLTITVVWDGCHDKTHAATRLITSIDCLLDRDGNAET